MSQEPTVPPERPPHDVDHRSAVDRSGQFRALAWALGVNAGFMIFEFLGGLAFGSLALLADATHLLSDVAALGIALGAVVLSTRPTSARHTFGFARAEVLAAQISAVLMLVAGVWVLAEAVSSLGAPGDVNVNGIGMAAVATVGLGVNAGSAVLLHRAQGESLNMRASVAHLATDAAGSLAALVAGVLIWAWAWTWTDSVASLGTGVLVLWAGWGLLRSSTHVLMEGTPRHLDPADISATIRQVPGVVDVHDLHLWNLASDVPACSAHVVLAGQSTVRHGQEIADRIKDELAGRYRLTHVTLEIEDAPGPSVATPTAGAPSP